VQASAEVYSGSTSFDAPVGTPSLNGPTPDPAQTAEYLHTLSASYDDQSGTVTIRFSLYDPATWGAELASFSGPAIGNGGSGSGGYLLPDGVNFDLGWMGDAQHPAAAPGPAHTFCNPGDLPGVDTYALGGPVLDGSIFSEYNDALSFVGNSIDTSLSGYSGDVTGPVAFDGSTFTATVQSPHFVGRVWDCFVLDHAIVFAMRPPASPAPPKATVPKFVDWDFAAGAAQVAVRPARIGFYDVCEPGFAGTRSTRSKLTWRRWTSSRSVGAGAFWTVPCFGAKGRALPRYPVRLTLFDAKRLRVRAISSTGHPTTETVRAFTALRIRFTRSVPRRWHRSHTYHLIEAHGAIYYRFSAGW
jgi:hypothetical protein